MSADHVDNDSGIYGGCKAAQSSLHRGLLSELHVCEESLGKQGEEQGSDGAIQRGFQRRERPPAIHVRRNNDRHSHLFSMTELRFHIGRNTPSARISTSTPSAIVMMGSMLALRFLIS